MMPDAPNCIPSDLELRAHISDLIAHLQAASRELLMLSGLPAPEGYEEMKKGQRLFNYHGLCVWEARGAVGACNDFSGAIWEWKSLLGSNEAYFEYLRDSILEDAAMPDRKASESPPRKGRGF